MSKIYSDFSLWVSSENALIKIAHGNWWFICRTDNTKKPSCGRPHDGFDVWWAPRESNPAPTDYAYHYGFRHPFRVCGLDCLLSLRPARTVSTRSLWRELRSGLPRCFRNRGFPEFEQFYQRAEQTYPKATQFVFSVL